MISYSDLRRGMAIELDGEPYLVLDWQHIKMQQRAPVLTLKVRHLRTGRVFQRNIPGDSKLTVAPVENRPAQYLYQDGDLYYFMDTETYDQLALTQEQLGDSLKYLKEQAEVSLVFYKGEAIAVELPTTVELQVVSTPPGVRGDTAQAGTKPATLETGLVVQVPLFVNQGDKVRVDTRTGQYVERVG